MATTNRVVLAMTVAVALSGCATTSEEQLRTQGLEPLSQAELVALFDGTVRADWKIPAGEMGTSVYRDDGTAKVDWGMGSSEGTYRFVDGEFCTSWEELRDGHEACGPLYRTGEGEYVRFVDGELNSTWWLES